MSDQRGSGSKVDLATERDFVLGGLKLSPSGCTATSDGVEQHVEPRVMEVLIFLVRHAGRTVTRDQLISACWEGRAVSDDAVSRVIARIRTLGRGADPPHFSIETIPKVGFRLSTTEPATAASTPVMPSTEPPFGFAKRRSVVAAAGAAVVLVLAIWLSSGTRQGRPASLPGRVIVEAFSTMGSEPELVALAQRAQDAAIHRFTESGIPTVKAAPSGVAPSELQLRLQGSVERLGDKNSMRLTLILLPAGLTLWSDRFERKISDPDGLEEEAVYEVAAGLPCALKSTATANWHAEDPRLPLLFESCLSAPSLGIERRVSTARRLVAAAPDLALAHGLLALALAEQSTAYDNFPEQSRSSSEQAEAAANIALSLNNKEPLSHLALAARSGTTTLAVREEHLKRALSLDPQNMFAMLYYSRFLMGVGRLAAARELLVRTEGWPATYLRSALIDAMNGHLASAENQLQLLSAVKPDWARTGHWNIAAFWEDPRRAITKLPALSATDSHDADPCIISYVTAIAAAKGRALKGLPEECSKVDIDWRVRMLARQGDVDGAYALLNGPWPISRAHWFLFYPEMKVVRADPRFEALANRLGLIKYWQDSGSPPDFCLSDPAPAVCQAIHLSK